MPHFDRRSFARAVLSAAAAMLTVAARPAVAAPFINGSFESPTLTFPSVELDATRAPDGWFAPTVEVNGLVWNAPLGLVWNIPLVRPYGLPDLRASDGDQFVTLQYGDVLGRIAQTFDTQPGQVYRVEFDLSATTVSYYGANSPQTFTLTAEAPGVSRDFSFTTAGRLFGGNGVGTDPWTRHAFDFVADGPSSTLTFINRTHDWMSTFGTSLDNVTVQALPIPEPAAVMPIVLAGAWLLLSRRRRRPARDTP